MSPEQKISYALFAAEQVISIFEEEVKDDKRPREAIDAAKEYLKNPTNENRDKCRNSAAAVDAAADEAYVAYHDSAAAGSSYASYHDYHSHASYPASAYAVDAAYQAVDAAYQAVHTASDPDRFHLSSAQPDMKVKILSYGYKLLTTNQGTKQK